MNINLIELAKKANEVYVDVELSVGTVRVYHIPDAVLLSGNSVFSEPDIPMVSMKTATGTQDRQAKKGDKEFAEWENEVAAIREYHFELRQAKGFVHGLKDLDWSNIDLNRPPTDLARNVYNGNWPTDEVLQKKAWLDFTILSARKDKELVLEAMNKMNEAFEPTAGDVDEVKKNSD